MSTDPFDTLGLPPRFDLDPAEVLRAYLERSATMHPDRAGVEGGAAAAAGLNAARAVLDDPEQRAGALLARLGGAAKEEDRSLPDGFLMEMMTAREELEAARGKSGAVERWVDWAEARRRGHIERVQALFARVQSAPEPAGKDQTLLRDLRKELNAWRYIERMIEQIEGDSGGHGGGGVGGAL